MRSEKWKKRVFLEKGVFWGGGPCRFASPDYVKRDAGVFAALRGSALRYEGKMAYKRLKQANGCVIGHPSSSFAKGYGGQVAVIRDLIISD